MTSIFAERESQVRSYPRSFPVLFATAKGEQLTTDDGVSYLDFMAGAGSMNYGHNPEFAKQALIDYLTDDGLANALDLSTTAKGRFLDEFSTHVLAPRGLDHKVQFTSPSGTNAVEAALKIARLVTGRTNIVSFSGAFHGVSTGSLAATSFDYYRRGLHATLPRMTAVPYPVSPMGEFDSLDYLERLVGDPCSGAEKPAAVILETLQGEGGVYVAPTEFLRGLRAWCDRHQVLLIVDDIQVGCGRTGSFFSFERAGIVPDLITLSKSISAYGLPMALLLIKPEYDIWQPGQHNGTFRGNQLAFVAAAAAIREHWTDDRFAAEVRRKGAYVEQRLRTEVAARHDGVVVRGLGLIWGIDLGRSMLSATKVSQLCFERGLIVEICGRDGEVIKLLPPLTISDAGLAHGLDVLVGTLDEAGSDEAHENDETVA